MRDIVQEFRHALRAIVKNGTLTVAIFVSLSLGIGATASVFSLVDSFLVRPLPVPETDRVVRITCTTASNPVCPLSYPDFDDLRQRARLFEGITFTRDDGAGLVTSPGARPRITLGTIVTGDFFATLQLRPALGRSFSSEEDRVPGRDTVAMISYNLWQNAYSGSPDVIGQTIRLNTKNFTIIGVAPATFEGLEPMIHSEFYVPWMMAREFDAATINRLTDRSIRGGSVYARLKPGVSVEQARAEVAQIAADLEREHPDVNRGRKLTVFSQVGFRSAESPEDLAAAWLFLLVAVLVLGAACVNVANLLLATAPARTRDIAVRTALGASQLRVIARLVVENTLISAAATAAGLGIAALAARFIRSVEIMSTLPISLNARVDGRVALVAFAVGLGSGILSGLVPAFRCSRADLNTLLRSTETRMARSKSWGRHLLVITQVAAATILLVLSGLSLRSLRTLQTADPGFRFDNVIAVAFDPLMGTGYSTARTHQFYGQLLERVRALPGVRAAGLGQHVPLLPVSSTTSVTIDGYILPGNETSLGISSTVVSDGYFDALGIPILRGRAFDKRDTRESSRVVIINDAAAEKFWPNHDALGARIQVQGPNAGVAQVVGIARTSKYGSIQEKPIPFLYLPLEQTQSTFMELFVTADSGPAAIPAIRNAAREVDPSQPIYDVRTMTETVRKEALWGDRLAAQVMMAVAVVGLILGVLGLYSILAYSVSQRRHEIGIRMAIGATGERVRGMMLWHGLKLSAWGTAIGAVVVFALAPVLRDVIGPADPHDTATFMSVVVILLGVASAASYFPARRASQIDPNDCLRCE
jgi:putative ABC transport system permease protein